MQNDHQHASECNTLRKPIQLNDGKKKGAEDNEERLNFTKTGITHFKKFKVKKKVKFWSVHTVILMN